MEETRKVYTPIPRTFEVSDSSDNEHDKMTEVEWRDEEPYMTPTKKGEKPNKGNGVKRPATPERPIPNMPQTPSRKNLRLIGPSRQSHWPMRMNRPIWESLLVSIFGTQTD